MFFVGANWKSFGGFSTSMQYHIRVIKPTHSTDLLMCDIIAYVGVLTLLKEELLTTRNIFCISPQTRIKNLAITKPKQRQAFLYFCFLLLGKIQRNLNLNSGRPLDRFH